MYANTTVCHGSMWRANKTPEESVTVTAWGALSVNLRDVYLSLQPEEAEELALALLRAAAQAKASEAVTEAPAASEDGIRDEETRAEYIERKRSVRVPPEEAS